MFKDPSDRYYQKKERLQKKLIKFQIYGRKQYKNLPEDKTQRLAEYRKNIINHGKMKQMKSD